MCTPRIQSSYLYTQGPRGCLCIPKGPEAVEIETTVVIPVPLQLLPHPAASMAASVESAYTVDTSLETD
jgi:hypothetical protein